MGKEKLIPVFAMIVLLIGTFSAIYVHATQVNKDTITINGMEYTINQLFSMGNPRTIETDEGKKSGVALDDIMIKIGVGCPVCNKYTIKAKDGYQQTVTWENMQNGILARNSIVFFSNTPKGYWIRDVIEIEVKK